MNIIHHYLNHLLRDESGQDLIEYALVAALIGLAAVAAMTTLGTDLTTLFNSISSQLTTAAAIETARPCPKERLQRCTRPLLSGSENGRAQIQTNNEATLRCRNSPCGSIRVARTDDLTSTSRSRQAMNSRRMLVALVAALVISGVCTLLLSRRMTKKTAPSATGLQYLVATQPIAAGEQIQAASLKPVSWPKSSPLEGGFQSAAGLDGRTAIYPVAAGEPILNADLAAPGSGLGIAAHIPDGMRAVALRTDDVVAVGGFIYPGSHVDVLVTYALTNNSAPVTAVVLEDVDVLATGQKTEPDPKGKPTSVNIVTLLLTPQQAEKAVLASAKGSIHFVLRNGADKKQIDTPPVNLAQLVDLSNLNGASRHTGHAHHRTVPAKPAPYTVETILGNRTEKTTF